MNRRLKSMAKLPFAPVVAAMFGVITLILIFMTPGWLFERMVVASGLPSLIAAAQPPLGETARKLSAIAGGLGVFASLWLALALLRAAIKRNAPPKARGSRIDAAIPVTESDIVKRKRDPIFAERELGAPFMSDEAIAVAATIAPAAPTVAEPEAVAEPMVASSASKDEPLILDRIAPALAVEEKRLASELSRLEAALERRAERGLSAKPLGAGDIASLRNALRGLV
jgi:hypothetical protein